MQITTMITITLLCSLAPNKLHPAKFDKTHDYCKDPTCPNKHTLCTFKLICSGYYSSSPEIYHYINLLRQSVALGRVPGLPRASNMMEIHPDNELFEIAEAWWYKCVGNKHDICRNTAKGESVGQTMYWLRTPHQRYINDEDLKTIVSSWFDEIKYDESVIPTQYLADSSYSSYPGQNPKMNYRQLVTAITEYAGCVITNVKLTYAFPELENSTQNTEYKHFFIVCDYKPAVEMPPADLPKDNPYYKRIMRGYRVGRPCSQCPKGGGCSKSYPGLCTRNSSNILPEGPSKIPNSITLPFMIVMGIFTLCMLVLMVGVYFYIQYLKDR